MQQQYTTTSTCSELYTIERVQERFKISRSTVKRYAKKGWLTKISFGINSARITADSVHSLLARLAQQ